MHCYCRNEPKKPNYLYMAIGYANSQKSKMEKIIQQSELAENL